MHPKLIPYSLLAALSLLIALYVALLWQAGDTTHLAMSSLFGVAVGSLLWEKRPLPIQTHPWAIATGMGLIGLILWQSMSPVNGFTAIPALRGNPALDVGEGPERLMIRLMPVVSALGLVLVASGFKGIKHYCQELTILFFLGVPSILISFIPDLSPITAHLSALFLFYSGFTVIVEGVNIHLPTGSVEVYAGCSGMESMIYLLGMSVLCLVLSPVTGLKRWVVPPIAILIGYLVNAVRVAIMAVLAASGDQAGFTYWHVGDGSLVFGAIAILLFWGVYAWLLQGEAQG